MVEDLEAAIYDALVVQEGQVSNGFLGEVDDALGEIVVQRYAGGSMQYWRVEPNTDLWCTLACSSLHAGLDGLQGSPG